MIFYCLRNNIYYTVNYLTDKVEIYPLKRYYFIILIIISLFPVINIFSLVGISLHLLLENQRLQIKAVLKYKNMKTHLEDSHNNNRVKKDESKKLLLSDVISSVEFRIAKHREFIKRDEQVIVDNVDCANIVTDAIERINERRAKIGELQEFIQHCL